MFSKKFLKRKRRLWHNHFIPSLIATIFVGILAFAYETSFTNVILVFLVIIRFSTYLLSQHLLVKEFFKEFKKTF